MADQHDSTGPLTHQKPFPRGALIGAALLIGFSLLLAALARYTGVGVTSAAGESVVASYAVRFADRDDGSVAVFRDPGGEPVTVLAPGSNGFVRGVMRGMARERRMHDVGPEAPFVLKLTASDGLRLHDPATDRTIDLQAFGADNYEAFASIYAAAAAAAPR